MRPAIKYRVVGGNLPIGTTIGEQGSVGGGIDFDNLFPDKPEWTTEGGNLGTFDEGETPVIPPLVASARGTHTLQRLSVLRPATGNRTGLPWGLILDTQTGEISGTLANLKNPYAQPFVDDEVPTWETESGFLASKAESEKVNITLKANGANDTPINRYFINKGGLPWGLTLNSKTGVIDGETFPNVSEGSAYDEFFTEPPAPVWETPRGVLAVKNELDNFDFQLLATGKEGATTKQYFVKSGGLPWGINMTAEGRLSGVISKTATPRSDFYYIPGAPTITGLSVSGSLKEELEVTVGRSTPISIGLEVGITNERQLDAVVTLDGSRLPWGLTYDSSTRHITGTVSATAPAGEYVINFRLKDSATAYRVVAVKLTVSD